MIEDCTGDCLGVFKLPPSCQGGYGCLIVVHPQRGGCAAAEELLRAASRVAQVHAVALWLILCMLQHLALPSCLEDVSSSMRLAEHVH